MADVSSLIVKIDTSQAVPSLDRLTGSARTFTQELNNTSRATLNFAKSLTPATDALKRQTAETAAARAQAMNFKQAMDGLYLSVDLAKSVNDKMTASLRNGKGDWIDMIRNMINAREGALGMVGAAIRLGTNLYLVERAISTVTGAIKAVFGPMVEAASAMERMAVTYRVLAETPAAGNSLLTFTKDLARYLPITVDALDKANRTLLGFNFTTQEITEVLVRLANVTQGNSENFSHLALVYGQVRAQGKAMQQDMYQFVNAGIPIMEALADVLDTDTTAIRRLVSEGAIGLPQFEEAIRRLTEDGGRFADFTEKTATVFQNQLVVATNNWKQILAEIGNVILPALSGSLAISVKQMQDLLGASDISKRVLQSITIEQMVSGGNIPGLESFFSGLSGVAPEEVKNWVGLARRANPLPTNPQLLALQRAEELLTKYENVYNAPVAIPKIPTTGGLASGGGVTGDNTIYGQLTPSEMLKAYGLFIDPSFYPKPKMGQSMLYRQPTGAGTYLGDYIRPRLNMDMARALRETMISRRPEGPTPYEQVTGRDLGYQGAYITPQLDMGMGRDLRDAILGRFRKAPAVGGGITPRLEARLAQQMMMETPAYGAGRTAEYNPIAMPYPQTWWPAPTGEEAVTMPYTVGGAIPRGVTATMDTTLAQKESIKLTEEQIEKIREGTLEAKAYREVWEKLPDSLEQVLMSTSYQALVGFFEDIGAGTLDMKDSFIEYVGAVAANLGPLFLKAGLEVIGKNFWAGVALMAMGGVFIAVGSGVENQQNGQFTYDYGNLATGMNQYSGTLTPSAAGGSRAINLNVQNIDQSSKGVSISTETSTGPGGEKIIRNIIRDTVQAEIASGGMDKALRSRGLSPYAGRARS